METFWIVIVLALLIIALFGTFIPILPSITIGWAGMLILYLVSDTAISGTTMLWITAAAILVKALDIMLPLGGVKIFGGTKKGVTGATVGLIIATFWSFTPLAFLCPPFVAIIIMPIIGAFIGELIADGGDMGKAIGGAVGSLLGFFLTVGCKFLLIAWYLYIAVGYIKELIMS
ncbi:MAG: DUF456 domain-containing protein [Flavobacteriales bacterium]|nr:DUF456 domain-containing protein [Flavobacteriales bacterium]